MASLNKLAIRGIRSFDDKHVQVIEFYSPLTVIVGHNGSGKTTIIECLKYATTGDLPPNTKGGAFVHDPKMANEKEVKAQVRLRFWNVNRQRMTVTRSLQVTIAKTGKLSMKTLEGLLAKSDPSGGEGKRNAISTKCSELDEEVPLLMGVSKAILENVIFCHQEDSNWPLAEPAALKKKFDDIFEATKYTKALDNIKALRKERTQELKVDNERLKFLKADKEKAVRMRADLEAMVADENKKATEVDRHKSEFHRLKAENDEHFQRATGFQHIFERHETLKGKIAMYEENKNRMMEGLRVLTESTDELQKMYRNFDQHVNAIEAKVSKQLELRDREDEALDDLHRRERILLSSQGALQNNRKIYERNLRERELSVRDLAKTHNIPGYDYSPLEEHKVVEFVDKLHELVRKAESDLKKIQTEGVRKEREMQSELDQLSNAKTTAIATKQSKQDQITQLNAKIRNLETSFDSFSSVDADISVLENDIAATETRRDTMETAIQEARYDEQIRERISSIRQKEAERDKFNSELSILNRQADTRAQLAIKRSEVESRSAQVAASVQTHGARFKELIGSDLDPATMEEVVTTATSRRDRELQDAESAAAASERSLSQLQTTTNIAKQQLKSKTDDLAKLERTVNDALEESGQTSVDDAIAEAQAEVNVRKDELSDSQSSINFYRKIMEVGKTKKKCLGCDRAIQNNEKSTFETYIQTRIERLSSKDVGELKEELEQWESELEKLRRVQPAQVSAKNLREKEIPDLKATIADGSAKLTDAQKEVDNCRSTVQTAKLAVRDLQTLKSVAAIMARSVGEIKDLKADVQRLERDLQSTGSLKTVDDIQREIEEISNQIKNLQREQSQMSSEKELKVNTLRGLNDEFNRRTLRLGELRGKQERRKAEEASLREQQQQIAILQRELKELDIVAQSAVAPWREKNDALDRYRNERLNAEDEASTKIGIYQSSLNELESTHKACTSYVTEGNDRKMRENEAHLEDMRREITATQESRAAIEKQRATLEGEVARANETRKNIKNNLDVREETRKIEQISEELDSIDLKAAAQARKEFHTKFDEKLSQQNEAQNSWQLASGQLMQMTEERKRMEKTLKMDYKEIDKQFREQLIKTKTSEVANHDLEKYGKALDNAILRYHAIKMDEINDTIGHLWSKTYQGTDIDGIRIVSDHDEASTGARKSYNYRVVMVKNDVELDMRGRCSAGQKVLASIIIRLALAESFGQGCGVLALDEPTTNLDQENINALAEALAEIIRERRRQANFQLIVITHDEGFLQRLAAHDVLEYYWRVSRDPAQKSTLERQRVGI